MDKKGAAKMSRSITRDTEYMFNLIAHPVADIIEAFGNSIQDAFRKSKRWYVVLSWPGSVMAGFTNFIAAFVKGIFGVSAGLCQGLILVLTGSFYLRPGMIQYGMGGFISVAVGAVISVVATLICFLQRALCMQEHDRPLATREKSILEKVFLKSLSLKNIRIVEGNAGLFSIGKNIFVLNNCVFFNHRFDLSSDATLVHEAVHAWQYQHHGPRYIADALAAQAFYGRNGKEGNAYDWRKAYASGLDRWLDFNAEAQAQFIEDLYRDGYFSDQLTPDAAKSEQKNHLKLKYSALASDAINSLRKHSVK